MIINKADKEYLRKLKKKEVTIAISNMLKKIGELESRINELEYNNTIYTRSFTGSQRAAHIAGLIGDDIGDPITLKQAVIKLFKHLGLKPSVKRQSEKIIIEDLNNESE